MVIYEFSTLKVTVDGLENSLAEYSRAGWEVVDVIPSVYSGAQPPFTELVQVLVIMRNPIGETPEN